MASKHINEILQIIKLYKQYCTLIWLVLQTQASFEHMLQSFEFGEHLIVMSIGLVASHKILHFLLQREREYCV